MEDVVTTLAEVAPRLFKAYTQRQAEIRAYDVWLAEKNSDILRLKRLVAHRDLQLVRAQWRGQPSYLRAREKKLLEAREDLKRVQKREFDLGKSWQMGKSGPK